MLVHVIRTLSLLNDLSENALNRSVVTLRFICGLLLVAYLYSPYIV